MKEIIENKIAQLDKRRYAAEHEHLYYLKTTWKECTAQINILNEVLREASGKDA